MSAAIILTLAIAAVGTPQADGDATAAHSIVGPWRLSLVGGKVVCTLALSDRETPGGRDLQSPAACQRAFPPLKDLSVWSLDPHGGLTFSDPDRRHVVAFVGPAGGPYAATAPDGRFWRLAAAPPKSPADPTP